MIQSPSLSRASVRPDGHALGPAAFGIALVLLAYASLYPPFQQATNAEYFKLFRLFLETSILAMLAVSLALRAADRYVTVFAALWLYLINWQMSGEVMENVLSYFVKLALLVFLSAALRKQGTVREALARVWIAFWVYCVITGAIGYVLLSADLVAPTTRGEAYLYYSYPLIGNFLMKGDSPRYVGFLTEPIQAGLFFGFNMVTAKALVRSQRGSKWFFRLNLLGGLMTASYAFFLFLVALVALRSKTITRLVANRLSLAAIIVIILASISALLGWLLSVGGALLPYSSVGARIGQYIRAVAFLQEASVSQWVFGSGILPFHLAIGGGASAGILDVLASRGVIIAGVWLYVIHSNAKRVPGLFAYIFLYSLVLDFWHFPLFIIGLSVAAAISIAEAPLASPSKSHGRHDPVARAATLPLLAAQSQ